MTELLLTPDMTVERRFEAIKIRKLQDLARNLSRNAAVRKGREG